MAGQQQGKQGTFFLPETPPLTPVCDSNGTFQGTEIELKTFERTPRKSSNPQQTPVHENKEDSVSICFKFVQSSDNESTPELSITSTTPVSLSKRSRAKRRLWSGDSEPLVYIDLDIRQKRARLSETAAELSDLSLTIKSTSYLSPSDRSDPEDDDKNNPTQKSYCNSEYVDPEHQQKENEYETKYYSLKCSRSGSKTKVCASCSTRKTPLWRDSDDGTPYCNACGIRFKKYRVRCSVCLYIPRKDEKTNNCCYLCGSRLVRCRFSGHGNY